MGKAKLLLSANLAWNLYNFRAGLIAALKEQGYHIIAAAPPDAEYEAKLRALGCDFQPLIIDAQGLSPLRDLETLRSYRRIMRETRPDAFLGWTIKPNIYGALAAKSFGIPTIANISGLGTAYLEEGLLTELVSVLYRAALSRAQTVFFQNADDRDVFLKRRIVREGQTRLLPGSGIDLARFAPDYSGDHPRGRFLMIARLLGDKGVREYVAAARIMKSADPSLKFVLLGPLGVENRTAIAPWELNSWVAERIIDYVPPIQDVRPQIREADFIVLPSYREGTSRVLLEAAAMGRPIITTDVPGCREIVEHGVSGFLCAPRDAGSLAEAMGQALALNQASWRAMGEAGRAKAEAEFAQEKVFDAYGRALSRVGGEEVQSDPPHAIGEAAPRSLKPVAKIAISINTSWNFVNFRKGLIDRLMADGHHILALAPDDKHFGALEGPQFSHAPIALRRAAMSPFADMVLIGEYLKILRRERPDILLTYTAKPNVFGSLAARGAGIPVINNVAGLGRGFMTGSGLKPLLVLLHRLAFTASRHVFVQNPEDYELLRRSNIVAPEKVSILPGSGVDLDHFAPRESSGPGEGPPVFLFVGRLLWPKGIAELVEAARKNRRRGFEADVRLLGFIDADDSMSISQADIEGWQEKGLVTYLGTTNDVREPIAAADCVVLPSYYPEGTPRSLLEAAAMGKPIITTDHPGCRDVVEEGVNGFLCAPRDPVDLAEKLRRFADLPRERKLEMGRESRRIAEARFSEKIIVEAYLKAMDDLIGEPAIPARAETEYTAYSRFQQS